jgi:hypothetical protein
MRTSLRKTAAQVRKSDFVDKASGVDDRSPPAISAAQSSPEMRESMIRLAAYSFYERRGLVGGDELEDWLQAEMEVDRRLSTADVTRPSS